MDSNKLAPKGIKSGLKSDLVVDMVDYLIRAINDTDDNLAWERVVTLKNARPQATTDELVNILIRQKCLQAGAIGAITAGTSLIPGGGLLVTFTFGVAADLTLTLKMQAELVLEVAAVYQRRLRRSEKRHIVLLVTGMSATGDQIMAKAGTMVARRATEQLAAKSAEKALPVISIAASAGKNILTTYIVGQRAQAYFSLNPEDIDNWYTSFKAVSGIDIQHVVSWLAQTTERSWQLFNRNLQNVTAATIVAGQTGGEVMLVQADKMGRQVLQAGHDVVEKAWAGGEASLTIGKNIGENVAAGATVASWVAEDAGQSVLQGVRTVAGQASSATQRLVSALPYKHLPRLAARTADEVKAITTLTEPNERITHIIAGCQTTATVFNAFDFYFRMTMQFPCPATWHDPDEPQHSELVTILYIDGIDARRGVLFKARRGQIQRHLLAEQVWIEDSNLPSSIVLNDYRHWLTSLHG